MFGEAVGRPRPGVAALAMLILACPALGCEQASRQAEATDRHAGGGGAAGDRSGRGSGASASEGASALRYAAAVAAWAAGRPHVVLYEVDAPAAHRAHAATLVAEPDGTTWVDLVLVPRPPDGAVEVSDATVLWRLDGADGQPSEAVGRLGRIAAAPGNRVRRRPAPDPVEAWNSAAKPPDDPRERLRRTAQWLSTLDDAVLASPARLSACRQLLLAGGPFRREDVSSRRARIVSPHGTADLLLWGRSMVVTECSIGLATE